MKCEHHGCSEKQPRKNLNAIHSQLCLQRILCCQYCHKDFTCEDLKDHLKLCDNYPRKCNAKECDVILPRDEMLAHQTKECLFTIVACEWCDFGCDYKVMRKDLKNHHFNSTVKHLDCVKNVITKILSILPQDQVKNALDDLSSESECNTLETQQGYPSSSSSTPSTLTSTIINESFELHSSSITDEQVLQQLPLQHNHLKKLVLNNCEELTDLSITKIAQNYTQLQHLDLYGCQQITDDSIVQISQHCTQLKWLEIGGCAQITDNAIIQLSQNCTQLQGLGLSRLSKITDHSIIQISQRCKLLKTLCLWGCDQITNNSIIQLSQNCKQLRKLSLRECKHISDESVISLAKNCVELHALLLASCPNISTTLRDELQTLGIISGFINFCLFEI